MAQPITEIRFFKHTREFRVITKDDKTGDTFVEHYQALNPAQLAWLATHSKHEGDLSIDWK